MALCKFCGKTFAWGADGDKWVPLVPIGEDDDLARTFQDQDGALRANHRDVCINRGGKTVRVTKLAIPVQPDMILKPKRVKPDPQLPKIEEPLPSLEAHVEQVLERKRQRKLRLKLAIQPEN